MSMPLPPQNRINIADLKSQISKKLGPDLSRRYFSCLERLLAHNLSKAEFDKYCLSVLGRENIPLHNQLVRSILINVFQAKTMPSFGHAKIASDPVGAIFKQPTKGASVLNQLGVSVWSNGDIFPSSPRKAGSNTREQRIKDLPDPSGPNGRVDVTLLHSLLPMDEKVVMKNDTFSPCDLKRSMQHHQDLLSHQLEKRMRIDNKMSHGQASLQEKGGCVVTIEGDEEVHQRIPLQAPLGIPLCPVSVCGVQKSFPSINGSYVNNFSSKYGNRELCHTESLRKIMEEIAVTRGLEGVTMECSNLLNKGVDAYLKHLIESCYDLVRTRQPCYSVNDPMLQHEHQSKPINGIWPGNHMHRQRSAGPLDRTQQKITLQDFRTSMELNPQLLGEDWPLLLEKLCFRSYEE